MNNQLIDIQGFSKRNVSIFILWLFHISGIIGVSLGYLDWFISKTPLNLIIILVLISINFPIDTKKKIWVTFVFFCTGMLAEWIGVHYGFLFGEYSYGNNLGFKIDDVPILIGINWVILTLSTAAISAYLFQNRIVKIIAGALLMVGLDFFIEVVAPRFDFWSWTSIDAPLRNYLAWFLIAVFLHSIYDKSRIKGDFTFSLHLYLAQLLFFAYFYGFYRL